MGVTERSVPITCRGTGSIPVLTTNKNTMTEKKYNKIKKHLSKVEKIMGYKSGSLIKSLNIPEPSPSITNKCKVVIPGNLCALLGLY